MKESITAYLALGSNLGDRESTLRSAVQSLQALEGVTVDVVSAFIETEPVGPAAQERFFNGAVRISTLLSPSELLAACLNIERAHGRDRSAQPKWGPRQLDIDVLLYGDMIIDDFGPPRLRVPHPHMTERLFVLQPLAEIAADVRHPVVGLTMRQLLNRLTSSHKRNEEL